MNLSSLVHQVLPAECENEINDYLLFRRYKLLLHFNLQLKNKYSGASCFVIGNGPSLLSHDLKLLQNKYTFVVNFFCLHRHFSVVNPKFYMILDPVVLTRPLQYSHFIPYINKARNIKTQFLFSAHNHDFIESRHLLPRFPKYYFLGHLSRERTKPLNDFQPQYLIPFSDFTTGFSLLMAGYMGFKTIFIIGNDLNLIDGESHFYPEFRQHDGDHYLLYKRPVSERAAILASTLNKLSIIKKHLLSLNIRIYNATPGGYLDIFPRLSYQEAVRKS